MPRRNKENTFLEIKIRLSRAQNRFNRILAQDTSCPTYREREYSGLGKGNSFSDRHVVGRSAGSTAPACHPKFDTSIGARVSVRPSGCVSRLRREVVVCPVVYPMNRAFALIMGLGTFGVSDTPLRAVRLIRRVAWLGGCVGDA